MYVCRFYMTGLYMPIFMRLKIELFRVCAA
jgi:hypothetical protein